MVGVGGMGFYWGLGLPASPPRRPSQKPSHSHSHSPFGGVGARGPGSDVNVGGLLRRWRVRGWVSGRLEDGRIRCGTAVAQGLAPAALVACCHRRAQRPARRVQSPVSSMVCPARPSTPCSGIGLYTVLQLHEAAPLPVDGLHGCQAAGRQPALTAMYFPGTAHVAPWVVPSPSIPCAAPIGSFRTSPS